MRRQPLLCAALLVLAASSAGAEKRPDPSSPEFPAYVMRKLDDLYRGASSQGVMEMKVKTRHWTRSMSMESWSLGTDYTLVRILKPLKEKGTATLKAKNDLFIYLNKTGRTIKITSGMMGGSWMGSHFTNDDLLRETSYRDDYEASLDWTEEEGTRYLRVTLTPRPDAPVVYTRLFFLLTAEDWVPIRWDYLDQGELVRQILFDRVEAVAGRELPLRMVVQPMDRPEEHTEIVYDALELDIPMDDGLFTRQGLRRVVR